MILEGGWDILVDAIDTIGNKAVIDKAALDRGLPVYASMGAAMHFDPSAVRIATLKKTDTCPLASQLRKQMRDVDTSDMTCVYSTEPVTLKTEKRDEHGKGVLGSLPTVPAIFGMTLASLVIRRITGC
jgi:tRNA A37 threonylcarbamoyladenosine dehydratase